ncbi:hypothetical protein E3N88_28237 [Mikania micrantha]|uniref:Uncharacterized protein n=1 Tax=Mikania micrantha TaxID=192012 RepID=A0A5N6MZX7_9ASTR|nr:hypothetical protein E3N88_28237 [Mikania micrantha]
MEVKNLPPEVQEVIADLSLKERSLLNYKTFFHVALKNCGLFMKGISFHPDHPYLNVFLINNMNHFPKEGLCFLWYLFESFTIAMPFNSIKLLAYVLECQFEDFPEEQKNTLKMLEWFLLSTKWAQMMSSSSKKHCIVMFRRPNCLIPPTTLTQGKPLIFHGRTCFIHAWLDVNPSSGYFKLNYTKQWKEVRLALAAANNKYTDDISEDIMEDKHNWINSNPITKSWDEAIVEYSKNHLLGSKSDKMPEPLLTVNMKFDRAEV